MVTQEIENIVVNSEYLAITTLYCSYLGFQQIDLYEHLTYHEKLEDLVNLHLTNYSNTNCFI